MTDDSRARLRWFAGFGLIAILTGSLVARSAPPPPTVIHPGPYGSGIGADDLANTQVGGTSDGLENSASSYRFRASVTSRLESVRIYLISGSGYSGGTGGTMSLSVEADDGQADHAPSGSALASATIQPGNPIDIGFLPLIRFLSPATLTAGQLYHLVFRNTDPDPTINFVSLDSLWTAAVSTPRQPTLDDADWAQLLDPGSGWTVRQNYTPILDLGYADGVHSGMGYIEVWMDTAELVSGPSAVREVFSPRADYAVSTVSVRVQHAGGPSALRLQLETLSGTVLAEGSILAASVGSAPTWVRATLSVPVVLEAGLGYQLLLTSPTDSSYSAFAIERGNHYAFDSATYFNDGQGEYTTTGSSWAGFDQPGGSTDNTNSDLQFYFL